MRDAATREVREETGIEAELVDKLGDVTLLVPARGQADPQEGHLLPLRVPRRRRRRPRRRGGRGALDPARRGRQVADLQGRARDGRRGFVATSGGPIGSTPRAGPELLLRDLRRPAQARPQDGHDPPRRQVAQVPQERGRAGHDRLPALAAREDLRGRDRPGRGQARQGPLPARHRARQPRVPPPRGDDPLPRADLRQDDRQRRHRHRRPLLPDHRAAPGDVQDRLRGPGGTQN